MLEKGCTAAKGKDTARLETGRDPAVLATAVSRRTGPGIAFLRSKLVVITAEKQVVDMVIEIRK